MNVVLILADQLSARWLGAYGNPAAHTPNLDALAARGVRFERCYSNTPVCMPARATLITGRSPQHHGVFYNGYELGTDMPTYPHILHESGYQTLGIGKFHLECHGRGAYNDVTKYGFERAETTEDIRCGQWLDWVRDTYPEYYERALATVWDEPHLARYGPEGVDLRPAIRAAREKYPDRGSLIHPRPSIVPQEAMQTTWITERAIDFLRERDPARPFFLNVSYVDPHDPYDPPQGFLELIDRNAIPHPVRPEDPSLKQLREKFQRVPFLRRFADCDEKCWLRLRHYYLASVAFVDAEIGRLMAFLERSGLVDETLVIFTSDHGDMLGDHGYAAKGAWHFDACMRVPLIIAGPGVRSGMRDFPVSLLDLFPTILDYAGVISSVPVEGRSLRPLLAQTGELNRPPAVLVETYGSYGNMDFDLTAKSVVTRDVAYTRFGDGTELLFDLAADPGERKNIAESASSRVGRMRALMLDLKARQNTPLPLRHRHPFAQH